MRLPEVKKGEGTVPVGPSLREKVIWRSVLAKCAQRAVPQKARDQKEGGSERERKTAGSGERRLAGGLGCLHSLVADGRGDLTVALVYQAVLVDVHAGRGVRGNTGAGTRVGRRRVWRGACTVLLEVGPGPAGSIPD